MIKTNYYFLATALPALKMTVPPEINFSEFMTLLNENLSDADMEKIRTVRLFYDIENIRAFWKGEVLDYWGNLDINELEEALVEREGKELPDYVYEFLDNYESLEQRLKFFPQLVGRYFKHQISQTKGFQKRYFIFERDLRLTLVGYRARQLHKNLLTELQFEDPEDPVVAQLLAQKDAKTFESPLGFEGVGQILERSYTSPLELHQALYEYRFNRIDEMLEFDMFSIDRIMGYFVQYLMVDKWFLLDRKKGIEIVDSIVKEGT